jgi:hypothetical protein
MFICFCITAIALNSGRDSVQKQAIKGMLKLSRKPKNTKKDES